MMRIAFLLTGAALIATTPATARQAPPCPPAHEQLFIAPMGEPFRAPAGAEYPVAAWFAQADEDHDGKLRPAEFADDADRFFARLDANHDGEIDPDEVGIYERQIAPEIRLYTPGRMREPRTGRERRERADRDRRALRNEDYGDPLGAGRWAFLNLPEPVVAADDDLNRGVSREEFRRAAASRFAQIDTAHQGYLELATLPKTPFQTRMANCKPVAGQTERGRERQGERP